MKLAMKTIEYLVGGEHYRNFREYLAYGQMENLTQDFPFRLLEIRYFFGKTDAMRIFENQ